MSQCIQLPPYQLDACKCEAGQGADVRRTMWSHNNCYCLLYPSISLGFPFSYHFGRTSSPAVHKIKIEIRKKLRLGDMAGAWGEFSLGRKFSRLRISSGTSRIGITVEAAPIFERTQLK